MMSEQNINAELESDTSDERDLRVTHPSTLPSPRRWDARNSEVQTLLRPCPCAHWLKKLRQTLPWYETMKKSGGGPWLSLGAWDVPYECCMKGRITP